MEQEQRLCRPLQRRGEGGLNPSGEEGRGLAGYHIGRMFEPAKPPLR